MSSLPDLFNKESAALRSFISLLERERQLLVADEAEKLQELTEEKASATGQLHELGEARDAAFRQLNIATNRDALATWLATQSEKLQTAWQELLELAKEAQALNALNGKLINTHMQRNQEALNVLLPTEVPNNTYGPDGQQRTTPGGRTLGSA